MTTHKAHEESSSDEELQGRRRDPLTETSEDEGVRNAEPEPLAVSPLRRDEVFAEDTPDEEGLGEAESDSLVENSPENEDSQNAGVWDPIAAIDEYLVSICGHMK